MHNARAAPQACSCPIYAALAQAFAAEGVDTHFTLMGDGNMHWVAAMKSLDREMVADYQAAGIRANNASRRLI